MSACEGELVCKATNPKIPFFNAPIYTENKQQIGKIDEILGPLDEVYFTVKLDNSKSANAYKQGDKFYIGSEKLLPMDRFLPRPKVAGKGNYIVYFIVIDFVDLLTFKIFIFYSWQAHWSSRNG
jgi:H/ACA ribonucleoprotein complex subunit 1